MPLNSTGMWCDDKACLGGTLLRSQQSFLSESSPVDIQINNDTELGNYLAGSDLCKVSANQATKSVSPPVTQNGKR